MPLIFRVYPGSHTVPWQVTWGSMAGAIRFHDWCLGVPLEGLLGLKRVASNMYIQLPRRKFAFLTTYC